MIVLLKEILTNPCSCMKAISQYILLSTFSILLLSLDRKKELEARLYGEKCYFFDERIIYCAANGKKIGQY